MRFKGRPLACAGLLLAGTLFCSSSLLFSQERSQNEVQREEIEDYYEKWLKEDVVYIIRDEERSVFEGLTTPEEKEQFIEQFWIRRDPDPRTAVNEFKEEHYRRIAYANERFTSGDPGWMTDRGMIYIIHGKPDEIESRPSGGTYMRPIEEGGGKTSVYPYEKWRYRYIEGIGQDVVFEFVDKTWSEKYELAVYPWEKDAALITGQGATLAEQIGMATRADHPAFTPAAGGAGYGPHRMFQRLRDTPFQRYETLAKGTAAPVIKYPDLKEMVNVNVQYSNLPFEASSDYFRLNEAQVLVPITIQLDNRNLTFEEQNNQVHKARVAVYGIVTSMTNRVVTEFEDDFSIAYKSQFLEQGRERAALYQRMIVLEDGMRYKLDLVVKDLTSGQIGVLRKALIPPAKKEGQLSASSLVLASHVEPLRRAAGQNEMFVLGDVKVLPNLEKEFSSQMPLGVYLQVYNAAIDQTSIAPSLRVTYRLLKDGELLRMAVDEKGESTQFFSGQRVVLIKQLSLEGLDPGKYQIQVEIEDQLTDRRLSSADDFTVT